MILMEEPKPRPAVRRKSGGFVDVLAIAHRLDALAQALAELARARNRVNHDRRLFRIRDRHDDVGQAEDPQIKGLVDARLLHPVELEFAHVLGEDAGGHAQAFAGDSVQLEAGVEIAPEHEDQRHDQRRQEQAKQVVTHVLCRRRATFPDL